VADPHVDLTTDLTRRREPVQRPTERKFCTCLGAKAAPPATNVGVIAEARWYV